MQQYNSFFAVPGNKFQVKLADNQWINIKEEMPIGDWERFENSLLQIEAETQSTGNRQQRRAARSSGGNSKFIIKGGMLELLLINIVDWSFEGLPVTPDNIAQLNNETANLVLEAINNCNPINPLESGPQATISSIITSSEDLPAAK